MAQGVARIRETEEEPRQAQVTSGTREIQAAGMAAVEW